MKKGQVCEGIIERYTFPNKGYVKIEGREICIKGALKGQKVRFSVKKLRKSGGEGRLLEVLEKSPVEDVEPKCPHFGVCGGCAYQTMSYGQQLQIKEEQVKSLLDSVLLPVDGNEWENNRMSTRTDGEWESDGILEQPSSSQGDANMLKASENEQKDVEVSAQSCNERKMLIPSYQWDGIKGSPMQDAYRNKMEFSFGDEYKDGPLALGMHKKGSFHDVVTVDHCQIVDEDYNLILREVLDFYTEKQVPFYKKMQHIGVLRHLVVRQAACSKDILVNLVTTTQYKDMSWYMRVDNADEGEREVVIKEQQEACGDGITGDSWEQDVNAGCLCLNELKVRLLSLNLHGRIVGILHTHNDSLSDAVIPEKIVTIYGQDYIYEKILNLTFKISPFSFFQTNSRGAEVLYETVRSYVGETKDKVIFDLYSGTGTIAQMLAPVAKKVIGVEIVEEAVEAARENAALNGLNNCEFIAGDVLKIVDDITEKPDIIVLDPPRDGLHPKALQKIGSYARVERMIYISCKPTSLARDLVELQKYGYVVERACCVDMFPGTYHVETVCLLSKLHADQHIEVELQMDELDLTAAESKATYEEIKDYVLEHMGLKVSSLYIAQVKEKCGIIERANYNLSKSENSRQPKCPPEKEAAIRGALEHFRMI